MENRKLVIIIISVITMIVGLISMFYFSTELDKIGTYESINLLYMLSSQAVCGIGLVGLIVGLGLKNSSPESPFWGADTSTLVLILLPPIGLIVGAVLAQPLSEWFPQSGITDNYEIAGVFGGQIGILCAIVIVAMRLLYDMKKEWLSNGSPSETRGFRGLFVLMEVKSQTFFSFT